MRSLRRHLTAGMLLAFTLLLGAGGGAAYYAVRKTLYDQFDAALRIKALIVITDTQVAGGRIRVYFSDRFLREFDDALATEFFQVFDASGRPVEHSDSLPGGAVLPVRAGTMADPDYWNVALPNGEPGRAVGIRFQPPVRRNKSRADAGEPVEAIVVVAASRRALDQTVSNLRHVLLGVGLGALLLTAGLVPLALRRGLRPLDELAAAAARIDARSLEQRFDIAPLPRELQSIGRRLNDLLSRLQESFERERRFSTDIAHELRTPLAELRMLAEVGLKWPEERSPDSARAVLDVAVQMERLAGRLLELGRAEQGRATVERVALDVAPLIESLVAGMTSAMRERDVDVRSELPAAARLVSDPVILRSILANLIENAVLYSPAGSTVLIGWSEEGDGVRISVTNAAPGLEPVDLPRMFERFWRKDSSRSGGGHSGLGLALARSFARLLGGDLEASLPGSNVLVLTLRLPRTVEQRTG